MRRIVITGATGMLGRDLCAALSHHDVTALGRSGCDITDEASVSDAVRGHDTVINAAAYTAVDAAEEHEQAAFAVNARGPELLARSAREHDARLIHVSTDYVFSGAASTPYGEQAPHSARSAYGRSKAAGESAARSAHPDGVSIVRTAWLYGQHGSSFPRTMLSLARERAELSVVNDQIGQPTWTRDLAEQIARLVDRDAPAGVFHGTNSGAASWFEFAQELFRLTGLDPDRITPTDSAAFRRPAPRPSFSVLGHGAWTEVGLAPMRDWRDALGDAVDSGVFDAVVDRRDFDHAGHPHSTAEGTP